MIRENQQILNSANFIGDGIALVLAMPIAFIIRKLWIPGYINVYSFEQYMNMGTICMFAILILYSLFGLYDSFRGKRILTELGIILRANVSVTILLVVALFVLKLVDFSRITIILYGVLSVVFVLFKHISSRLILFNMRKNGYNLKRVVIIGSGKMALRYLKFIQSNKIYGFHAIGYITDTPSANFDIPYLGIYEHLEKILEQSIPDEAVIALSTEEWSKIHKIISLCEKSGTKLSVIPAHTEIFDKPPVIDEIGNIPLMNIRRIPLDNVLNSFMKRTMDILFSIILIILSSPVMIIAAIGTKLSSPGAIIFKQERLGLNKAPFKMYKFRSMRVNSKQNCGWTTNNDDRKTKFGSFIRKYSIDELPQLFNVLKGEMSLVGPRPELKYFVNRFKESIPLYMVKHQVRPGITGWAQVNGYRGDTSIEERINHDIYYIERWSLAFDIKILFMTVFGGVVNSEKIVTSNIKENKRKDVKNEQQDGKCKSKLEKTCQPK